MRYNLQTGEYERANSDDLQTQGALPKASIAHSLPARHYATTQASHTPDNPALFHTGGAPLLHPAACGCL